MDEENPGPLDFLKIGDKGLGASIAVWGIVVLLIISFLVALVASFTGSSYEPPF